MDDYTDFDKYLSVVLCNDYIINGYLYVLASSAIFILKYRDSTFYAYYDYFLLFMF